MVSSTTSEVRSASRPFLKWPGGKQWIAKAIVDAVKWSGKGTYFEPFLGGGSLFFAMDPTTARLSDSNTDLMICYRAVRDYAEPVIAHLSRLSHDRSTFDRIRKSRPTSVVERAVRFIYLNKTAFNGMYRVNRNGEFNVPFGDFRNPSICQPDRLRRASATLQGATVRTSRYASALTDVRSGDFVYLDPPYVTGHNNNGFIKYNRRLFSWDDQISLADSAKRLRKLGATVVITNAAHDDVLDLYADFYYLIVDRQSRIGGGNQFRGVVSEAVLCSKPFVLDPPRIERL